MACDIRSILGKELLYFDGGTGTMLQREGLKAGELPEAWNIEKADKIIELHLAYLKAGANIIKTNTFGAYTSKFPMNAESVVSSAVHNAKEAVRRVEEEGSGGTSKKHFIALDIGPCGKLLKPMGDLDFTDAVALFTRTITAGLAEGVDAVLIETMNDCYEAKAAVIAAKEAMATLSHDIPIMVTTVYDDKGRALTGASPEAMVAILEGLGVEALGMNCSLGPRQMLPLTKRLAECTHVPIIVNPNAGLPHTVNGESVYDVDAKEFASIMEEIVKNGASIIGGCCGTTPEYIRATVAATRHYNENWRDTQFRRQRGDEAAVIASYTHALKIGGGNAPVLIGERINPTGKKRFKEALRQGNVPYIVKQGLEQEAAGAHVLDVNVGLPEIDEAAVMVKVASELQSVCSLPLQIDTSSPDVMEAALRRYNGKALVNSVNGKQEVMEAIFPIVKKYGGVVVALTLDENGIPPTAEGRVSIAEKIYNTAEKYGIEKRDIVIDPLAMAVSADSHAARETLKAIEMISRRGGHTILGVSNISFGLPKRELVSSAFFTMAMQAGLSCAIMNPLSSEMQMAYTCYCLLSGYDAKCMKYIEAANKYTVQQSNTVQPSGADTASVTALNTAGGDSKERLKQAIERGLKDEAAKCTRKVLEGGSSALDVIDGCLVPALDNVGRRFEEKTLYLPQLLMSAEAAAQAFTVIKEKMVKDGGNTGESAIGNRKVIVATVKGDIHDIGKNIVKALLENYGFTVIDLGKDVAPETVVEKCVAEHVALVGLSALMTTTVPSMEETIKQLRDSAPWAKVCVGGAVMTEEYAKMIGADFYGKDAMATVRYAREVFN